MMMEQMLLMMMLLMLPIIMLLLLLLMMMKLIMMKLMMKKLMIMMMWMMMLMIMLLMLLLMVMFLYLLKYKMLSQLTPEVKLKSAFNFITLVMCNLLTPLACVRLSKHYTAKTTTMYRSLCIKGNGIYITKIFRPDTEINGNNRL